MKTFAFAISGLLAAAPVFAQPGGGSPPSGQDGGSAPAAAAATAGEGDDRRICRRVEADSTSRISTRRLCLTAREWRDYQRRN